MFGPPVVRRLTLRMNVLRKPRAISCDVRVAVLIFISSSRVSGERGGKGMGASYD